MKKIAMTLVMAGFLLAAACSRPKEEAVDSKKTTPDPSLPTRMEKQQNAINRASEEIKKEEEQKKTDQSATPSVSPP